MRIGTMGRYAVRSVFDVAYHGGGQYTQIKDVSKRQGISQRYLEQIFNRLLKAGILESRRGPHGGYVLARDASVTTVGAIILAAQGPIVPVECLAGKSDRSRQCSMAPSCVTRHVWAETQRILVDYFDSVSIADLCSLAREQHVARELDHTYTYVI
jgi:Rrf2 family iron-sulfur cluster assembly transcriptional regulator